MRSVCIVSCSAIKRAYPTWAENLYASENFFLSRRYAHANFDAWAIFSAKHGLLLPGDIVAPYDRHIKDLSSTDHKALLQDLSSQRDVVDPAHNSGFTSLCIPEYTEILERAHMQPKQASFASFPPGEKHLHLRSLTDPHATEKILDDVYEIIHRLIDCRGTVPLREAIRKEMPSAGVYLFFDSKEVRLRDPNQLRIVRVGTHGVAAGSKASLKDRMRAHFGTTNGGGNHRSSIFRLHVGRSMISAALTKDVESWGEAEFPKDERLRRGEELLEAMVSEYIGGQLVAMLDVPGLPSKNNDRAYLEQNLIALLSNNYAPLDPSSHNWLGHYSDKGEIRKSALWNVNHTSQSFDPGFPDMLDYYVSRTLGVPAHVKPVAPVDWIASVRGDTRQLNLFRDP